MNMYALDPRTASFAWRFSVFRIRIRMNLRGPDKFADSGQMLERSPYFK